MTEITSLSRMEIPFVEPYQTGDEAANIAEALQGRWIAGDNALTRQCQGLLRQLTGFRYALLTPSCTAALEMAGLLADLAPGDEVVMPSFTFPSTANAVVLSGAVPVFVDIRPDTLNIDERLIEDAITARTKAIFVVHYAGVSCEMDTTRAIADRYGLLVLEDAAQALMSSYKDRPVGTLGHMSAISFHETKNIHCGEGGAFLTNDETLAKRAEIVREKGTNRSAFFRGETDKYSWVDIGSSYLPNELSAAFLLAQLRQAEAITAERRSIWARYHDAFAGLESSGRARRPTVPAECRHNGHIYYLLLPSLEARQSFIDFMRTQSIHATSHYVPLHSSVAGRKYGRAAGTLDVTDRIAEGLVRLPLWCGMAEEKIARVIDATNVALSATGRSR